MVAVVVFVNPIRGISKPSFVEKTSRAAVGTVVPIPTCAFMWMELQQTNINIATRNNFLIIYCFECQCIDEQSRFLFIRMYTLVVYRRIKSFNNKFALLFKI